MTTATIVSADISDTVAVKTALESLGVTTATDDIVTWTTIGKVFFAKIVA